MMRALVVLWVTTAGLEAATMAADSTRGARLFETLSCVQCHAINGAGGKVAPDLGRSVDRNLTPAKLAAAMWNHAPAMWAAMRKRSVPAGDLNDQAAADLFAYFYSVRFFEKPGDAARGKNLFDSKYCSQCHGLTQPGCRRPSQSRSGNRSGNRLLFVARCGITAPACARSSPGAA